MISALSSLSTGFSSSSLPPATSLPETGMGSALGQATGGPAGADFTAMLSDMTANAVSTMKTAEATSIQGLQGQASVQKVVDAVMQAETTLQTAMAIRDKVVSSYQELSRMSI